MQKPKLPIEVEMSDKRRDNDESEDPVDCWDPDEIVQHALKMSKVSTNGTPARGSKLCLQKTKFF